MFKFVLDLATMITYIHLKHKIWYLSFNTWIIITQKINAFYMACFCVYMYMCMGAHVPCH